MDSSQLQLRLEGAISVLRSQYVSFDESFRSYIAQYGDASVRVHEPCRISQTIDPVVIILGRTTSLFYRDSRRTLAGSLGSLSIEAGNVCVLGRREPPDSKLVAWSTHDELDIEYYDSRVRVIPSRIHAALFSVDKEEVYFADLGSTSGSILAGESSKPEPFVTLYTTSSAGVRTIAIDAKYMRPK